jgi:hypothetical protein
MEFKVGRDHRVIASCPEILPVDLQEVMLGRQ